MIYAWPIRHQSSIDPTLPSGASQPACLPARMGCSSSKQMRATASQVYRPPPSSFAVFNINTIEEPWLKVDSAAPNQDTKSTTPQFPLPILAKISSFEDAAPRSWDEVSKALEDLKPAAATTTTPPKATAAQSDAAAQPNIKEKPRKSSSFHTIEELDATLKPEGKKKPAGHGQLLPKAESMGAELAKVTGSARAGNDAGSFRPVRENVFILRDRQEREKGGTAAVLERVRWDPLSGFPEKCPPGGANAVVLYTTSLRGVRRTFEDCNRARSVLETHQVVFDERDVALHGRFLSELRDLLGEGERAVVPRLFVKGRYLGGVDEVVELNESGRLGRILTWARVERGPGMQGCEGCGGARFVPCLDCGGSCKVLVVGDKKEKQRCPMCNENGLVLCPLCH
ncbi:hypothetical protein Dimus_036618 [Dionaea muscipula]